MLPEWLLLKWIGGDEDAFIAADLRGARAGRVGAPRRARDSRRPAPSTRLAIEDFVDREAVVVPLYAAKRIAVRRRELRGVEFGEHGYGLDLARMRIVE